MCLMLGPFINILDHNVVSVALPKMMSGLATDILTIRWVVTASLIATAVVMPTLGWVGRTLGCGGLVVGHSGTTRAGDLLRARPCGGEMHLSRDEALRRAPPGGILKG